MSPWECAIDGCGEQFERVESAVVHQATDHDHHACQVCGTTLPDGYFAIKHAFEEHTRAEYVRAYDANAANVRRRESVLDDIESAVDLDEVLARIEQAGNPA
ncbi:hypothetical protein [Haladaptatus sp. DYSN1]|uniref:DUF7565 family protein n=1 Tax=unclassified Haladaptatus TaxID=2622732 RepID=UPI0024068A6F|nr:hypothetical protein [Haladaptatus sp. DYSN1]